MVRLQWHRFDSLSTAELYELLAFRQASLITEQQSPYPDLDGADLRAWHLVAREPVAQVPDRLVGYARILTSPGPRRPATFGRLVVAGSQRGKGLGRRLVREILDRLRADHPDDPIEIAAPAHLELLYRSFGFLPVGEAHDDYGVLQIPMRHEAGA